MPTLYVKKLWTLNPSGYKYTALDKAIKDYYQYVKSFESSMERFGLRDIKTFQEWLTTEI